jgi:hypothetical protein
MEEDRGYLMRMVINKSRIISTKDRFAGYYNSTATLISIVITNFTSDQVHKCSTSQEPYTELVDYLPPLSHTKLLTGLVVKESHHPSHMNCWRRASHMPSSTFMTSNNKVRPPSAEEGYQRQGTMLDSRNIIAPAERA